MTALAFYLLASSFACTSCENATCGWVPSEMRARAEASDVVCPGAWLPAEGGGNGSACRKSEYGDGAFNCDTPEHCAERCAVCAAELAQDGLRGCNAIDFQPSDGPDHVACWFRHIDTRNKEQVSGYLQDALNESIKSEYQLYIPCDDCSKDPSLNGCDTTSEPSVRDEDRATSSNTGVGLYALLATSLVFGFLLCLYLKTSFEFTFGGR